MKRIILSTLVLLAAACGLRAQISYKWTPVAIDSTWDNITDLTATKIIGDYSSLVAPLDEILCYSAAEYGKQRPESGLSNFAADAIKEVAEKTTGEKMDMAMTNFGGIRTSLPKGAIRVYDIYSIFPFNNTVVVLDIKGSELRKFLGRAASGWIEALSNVEILVDGRNIVTLNVNGAPIDDERMYKFATINFLLDGGDGVSLRQIAANINDTGVYIRDGIVDLLRERGSKGEVLKLEPDGRVKMINQPERRRR